MPGALIRYRIMCFVAGVMSLLLWFVELPVKYLLALPELESKVLWIPIAHGYIYAIYVLTAMQISIKARWSLWRIVKMVLAGTLPVASFLAERRVKSMVRET